LRRSWRDLQELKTSSKRFLVSISIDIDGLSVGVYNYTIVVFDKPGNSIADTVIVTVASKSNETTTLTSTNDSSGFTAILFLITIISLVIVQRIRKRRSE